MSKNPRDQIDKASWMLLESIRDAVVANVTAASSRGQIDVKGNALARLLTIINASTEEGYHRASQTFSKAVDKALVDAALPPLEAFDSKKKSG